ncbi:MAG: DUF2817 domain-containing protein [Planctomycetota bacterium]
MLRRISDKRYFEGASYKLLGLAVVPLLLAACNIPTLDEPIPYSERRFHTEVVGLSRDGRPIEATIVGQGSETLLLTAVIHGNEPAGKPLLERLIQELRARPNLGRDRRLIIVPVVNPDGLAKRTRFNARGVDLNRNFPSRNWKRRKRHGSYQASEPETRAVLKLIRQFDPCRILAVHSPLKMVNYDGPAEGLARAMSARCGLPAEGSVGYPTPGSLGSYAGHDWKIPTITLELSNRENASNVWQRFGSAVETFVDLPTPARTPWNDPNRTARTRTRGRGSL